MTLKKKVRLCITSNMRDDAGQLHTMKYARRGVLKAVQTAYTLEYDDEQDGEKAHITLTADAGRAQMVRRGMTSACLSFEPGRRTASAYVTMYGEIPVAVDTHKVCVLGDENGGSLTLDYDVYMGGEKTSSAVFEVAWRA